MTYFADVAALTRKDLRVELRGRDTLHAMLLFVLSTLVVFHFALPEGSGDTAAYGLLWVAIVFTALLGLARAWVPEQEHGVLDGLDECLATASGALVDAFGCSLDDYVPCAHPANGIAWKNHGAYVAAVAHVAEDFYVEQLITLDEKNAMVSTAAQSTCGAKR